MCACLCRMEIQLSMPDPTIPKMGASQCLICGKLLERPGQLFCLEFLGKEKMKKYFSLPSWLLIFVLASHFACRGTSWQWTHAFPLLHVPLPKVNNQDKYEEWEKYVLVYSDNKCERWNHLNVELKTTTSGSCYGSKRYWKKVGLCCENDSGNFFSLDVFLI